MADGRKEIIVGVLGQWASGKSTAAETLVRHLGGEGEVTFLTDREILARTVITHVLGFEGSRVKRSIDQAGTRRFDGDLATVYLGPEETLDNVDLNYLRFDLHAEIYDNVPADSRSWIDEVRLELGRQIFDQSSEGKPIVVEAGFGTNTDPRGENPVRHTISDLFKILAEAGVRSDQVKWIIIEASYQTRSERNRWRKDTVPAAEFDRFAADGGDLDPDQQERWVAQGMSLVRVPNNHDDVDKFRADIVAAFGELVKDDS
jgi:hypothetical protein